MYDGDMDVQSRVMMQIRLEEFVYFIYLRGIQWLAHRDLKMPRTGVLGHKHTALRIFLLIRVPSFSN